MENQEEQKTEANQYLTFSRYKPDGGAGGAHIDLFLDFKAFLIFLNPTCLHQQILDTRPSTLPVVVKTI